MTTNPLIARHSSADGGFAGASYNFHTVEQMRAECDRRNGQSWVIGFERWYFIAPAEPANASGPAKPARIEFIEGPKALEMRARANGTYDEAWKPEAGEMEWIRRAVAEFLKRHPRQVPTETPDAYRDRFQRQMAKWSAAKPWRVTGDAGEAA